MVGKQFKRKKLLVVLGGLVVGGVLIYAFIAVLKKFGYLLFGILVIAGFVYKLKTGTEKEKKKQRKRL